MSTARRFVQLATIAAVVAVVAIGAPRIDFAGLLEVLGRVDPLPLLILAPGLLAIQFLLRTMRFHALVRTLPAPPGGPLPLLDSARGVALSDAANNFLPFRAGELLRTRILWQRGYSLGDAAAAQVTEKVVELLTQAALLAPVVGSLSAQWLVVGLGLGVLPAGALAVSARLRLRARRALARLKPLLGARSVGRCVVLTLAVKATELGLIAIALSSLGIVSDWHATLTVFVAFSVTGAIPSTPAQVGALEATGAVSLALLGATPEEGIALALLYRAILAVPAILLGAVAWLAWPARGIRTAAPPQRELPSLEGRP